MAGRAAQLRSPAGVTGQRPLHFLVPLGSRRQRPAHSTAAAPPGEEEVGTSMSRRGRGTARYCTVRPSARFLRRTPTRKTGKRGAGAERQHTAPRPAAAAMPAELRHEAVTTGRPRHSAAEQHSAASESAEGLGGRLAAGWEAEEAGRGHGNQERSAETRPGAARTQREPRRAPVSPPEPL